MMACRASELDSPPSAIVLSFAGLTLLFIGRVSPSSYMVGSLDAADTLLVYSGGEIASFIFSLSY
jgi:hypothetical protein